MRGLFQVVQGEISERVSDIDNATIEKSFDAVWYSQLYKAHIRQFARKGEPLFKFYLRQGARLGHDPNPQFSELTYRARNHDIYQAIHSGKLAFGYRHWLRIGRREAERPALDQAAGETIRQTLPSLDLAYIEHCHPACLASHISGADFYFSSVRELMIDPNESFSEEGYLALHRDVRETLQAGHLISGYAHYVSVGIGEGRSIHSVASWKTAKEAAEKEEARKRRVRVLEKCLPGVTAPVACTTVDVLTKYRKRPTITLQPEPVRREIIALVPNFLPEILFGGYMAFFDYLKAVKAAAKCRLRLIVVSGGDESQSRANILRMSIQSPEVYDLFDEIETSEPEGEMSIGFGAQVISYCGELHYLAAHLSDQIGTLPTFFIQEYEADFHSSNDMRNFVESAFLLPHRAVYNSQKLKEYFCNHPRVGNACRHAESASLENYIRPATPRQLEEAAMSRNGQTRRLIFYARPEKHAERNLFGTFLAALSEAIENGTFNAHRWDFIGIGSLATEGALSLPRKNTLRLISKLPKADYERLLLTGDIGASFISTPHPGIIHYQMAAYGLTTITNTTPNRSREWIENHNGNLIATDPGIDTLVEALSLAVQRAEDLTCRRDHALAATLREEATCQQDAVTFAVAGFDAATTPKLVAAE